jgi:hypothetical protein
MSNQKLMNPFSHSVLWLGQIFGAAYYYTIEHFLLGFKSRIKRLQKQRLERYENLYE